MQVVILAAGRGERLLPLTEKTPKCLLDLGTGVILLQRQLLSIAHAGTIEEVLLVIGFEAEQVEARLKELTPSGLRVRTVYNPFYVEANNLVSLWLALPWTREDFIVVNGDNIFNPAVLSELAARPSASATMVIDRKPRYDQDDMKVITSGDRVIAVSKQIDPSEANGESIGMIRFGGEGAARLKRSLEALVRSEVGKRIFWLAGVQQMMDQDFPVNFQECGIHDWAEIDFHPDLAFVRSNLGRYLGTLRGWEAS